MNLRTFNRLSMLKLVLLTIIFTICSDKYKEKSRPQGSGFGFSEVIYHQIPIIFHQIGPMPKKIIMDRTDTMKPIFHHSFWLR